MVMGIIGLVFAIINLVLYVTGAAIVGSLSTACAFDDDIYGDFCAEVNAGTYSLAIVAVIGALQVLFYIFQIVAAIKYNVWMLATVIVVNLAWFVLAIIQVFRGPAQSTGNVVGSIVFYVIFFALEIYPTAGLLKEIKAGTMSKETYPREAYSCCCQPNPV